MTSAFDFEPNMGYPTSEPSLRKLVRAYYGAHFDDAVADQYTAEYFTKLITQYAANLLENELER